MQEPTPTQALASLLVGEDIHGWITAKREARPPWSYALIADELAKATGGKVAVSGEAVRLWVAGAEANQ
ncbi:MAG: hypothetical protein ABIP03_06065 [Aquihabitans sp.]